MTKENERQQHITAANQQAEALADRLWTLTAEWGEFAKSGIGLPLIQAVDAIGLNLLMSLGHKSVQEHMQYISHARKRLAPASYWLQRAVKRGLVDSVDAQKINTQITELARHLDQYVQLVLQFSRQTAAQQYRKTAQEGLPLSKHKDTDEIAEEPAAAH